MIHAVLQWQKRKPSPIPSNTGVSLEETRSLAGAETGSPNEATTGSGMLLDETVIESEALLLEDGAEVRGKISASVSDQAPLCDDDAGEGPSSLITEKPVPKQNEDKEDKLDEEQTGKLKRELVDSKIAPCKSHPKRPLLGLVLTPTRELAVQVKQHIDAVAKFTGEV